MTPFADCHECQMLDFGPLVRHVATVHTITALLELLVLVALLLGLLALGLIAAAGVGAL